MDGVLGEVEGRRGGGDCVCQDLAAPGKLRPAGTREERGEPD